MEKSGPNSIRWLPKMCRFAVSSYLHNSNSRPSLAQLQQCRIILLSAFGRYCTYVQTGVVVGKIERNLKPPVLVAVADTS